MKNIKNKNVTRRTPTLPGRPESEALSGALISASAFLARSLKDAREDKIQMVLFGDFDVDGTSSAAILYLFAKLLGVDNVSPYVSRRGDGYGLTERSVRRLLGEINDPANTVIVLMDLGINTTSEAKILLERGFRVMIIDHHVPKPDAGRIWRDYTRDYGEDRIHVYDPLLFEVEGDRAYKVLSAAGLVYKICLTIFEENLEGHQDVALGDEGEKSYQIQVGKKKCTLDTVLNTMTKICAIAQAADCMPFVIDAGREKRLSMAWSLAKEFEQPGSLLGGVKVLFELTSTASRIGWVIGPVLNAAGRLEDAYAAFELLIEVNEDDARAKLEEMQLVRRRVRGQTQKAADGLEKDLLTEMGKGVAVLAAEVGEVAAGVVGIGAARAADKFRAPALYLSYSNDPRHGETLKGSMRRGPTDFSCEKWILELREKNIIIAGGGHPAAAGLSLRTENLDRLLASAANASFKEDDSLFHAVGLRDALGYTKDVIKVLPFGNNHESARLLIHPYITEVRGLSWLSDTKENEVWAYKLSLTDPKTEFVGEAKLMAGQLTDQQRELFASLDGQAVKVAAQIEVICHDGFKLSSRYGRTDLRVASHIEDGEQRASIKFISDEDVKAAAAGTNYEFKEVFPRVEELHANADPRIVLHVDWDPSCHRRNFILRKPPVWEINDKLSEEQGLQLKKFHGGSWNRKKMAYFITWGVMGQLVENKDDSSLWRVTFSPESLAHYEELKREDLTIAVNKTKSESFEIPFLREGVRPYGFQYADIRLYLQRLIALSNNDMGTGKTIEGACWGALRHAGASIDSSMEIHIPKDAPKKPVLYLTLKGVVEQYAEELRRFCDLEVRTVATSQVSTFLKNVDVTLAQEDEGGSFKKVSGIGADDLNLAYDQIIGQDTALVVTTYDCVARNPWLISSFEWAGVCLDECHELKTPSAHKTRAVFGPQIDGAPLGGAPILAMSGTFTKNRPSDWFVWVRLTGADGGCYSGGATSSAQVKFDMRFDALTFEKAVGYKGREYTRSKRGENPENGEELRRLMSPFLVRRLKTEIAEVPPIEVNVKRVSSSGLYLDVLSMLTTGRELSETSQQLLADYNIFKDGEIVAEQSSKSSNEDDLSDLKINDPSSLASKLSMISSLDKACGIEATLGGLGWLDDDEPFVVMGMHQSATREVSAQLSRIGIEHQLMMQQDSAKKRQQKKDAFTAGGGRAFVTTYGVGGAGLNLTRANRILLFNLPWNESALSQARDRIHRIGQNRKVECVILVLSASIDEATYQLIHNKGKANYKTTSIDQIKKGKLPGWATGSITSVVSDKRGERSRLTGRSSGSKGVAAVQRNAGKMIGFKRVDSSSD